jgi:hypothetical protein
MKPRIGLYVALVGLVMAGLATICFFTGWIPYRGGSRSFADFGYVVLLGFGAILGLVVMLVGLALAGILAWSKRRNGPS